MTTEQSTLGRRYRSLFVVGKGGMGTVEAALWKDETHQESGEERRRVVALKRLLPDAARDRRRVEMFLREAKVASILDHPNIVTAYDSGEIDGELYLAMEYVEGQPLSRFLGAVAEAKKEVPLHVVAHVLAEVCRGLHAAHQLHDPASGQPLNLVHRDVSPQNVMLGYDGRVRLLDFGVAKIETESVTKTGEVKGKTAYMSPEQAMGDPLDRRSDLFSVGALLFECLALRRMWGDGTDMEVIRKLALEKPPGLEATGREALPVDLVKLHERLVVRDRASRPATASDVATALDAFVPDANAARATLKSLLEEHFATQAKEQRDRLDASLAAVAPAEARALRESIHPSHRPPATAPATAPATTARTRAGLLAAGVVAAGLVAWKALSPPGDPPKPEPTPAVTSAALPAVPAPSVSTPPPVTPTPPVVAIPSAPVSVTSPKPTPPPAPIVRPAAPATSAKPAASPSTKPPAVDDHPF